MQQALVVSGSVVDLLLQAEDGAVGADVVLILGAAGLEADLPAAVVPLHIPVPGVGDAGVVQGDGQGLFGADPVGLRLGGLGFGRLALRGLFGALRLLLGLQDLALAADVVVVLEAAMLEVDLEDPVIPLVGLIQRVGIMCFHKKIFLMAPLHHHFEKMGYKETDIVKGFWVVGLILSMAAIAFGVWI